MARHAGVRIGADSLLARGIAIRSSDIHIILDRATGEVVNPPAEVDIGDQVWMGHGVFIGKGVRVAPGCVLGAGAVLTRSFDLPHFVIAGHPARVVREGVAWER